MDKEWFVSQIDACSVTMYRMAWTILRNDADGNILPKGMNLTTPLEKNSGEWETSTEFSFEVLLGIDSGKDETCMRKKTIELS